MSLIAIFFSILLISICESAAFDDRSPVQVSQSVPLSRSIVTALPYLTRAYKVKLVLAHSSNFEGLRAQMLPLTFSEFIDDLLLFNSPELDDALGVDLDILVSEVQAVVERYIDCLKLPYCKFLPKGLRTPEGSHYANKLKFKHVRPDDFLYADKVISNYMTIDGKVNEDLFRKLSGSEFSCFVDDLSVLRRQSSDSQNFQIFAKHDKSVVLVSSRDNGSFALMPFARLLIRVVPKDNGSMIELWYADSMTPIILYDDIIRYTRIAIDVHISPDHQIVIVNLNMGKHGYSTKWFFTDYRKQNDHIEFNNFLPSYLFDHNLSHLHASNQYLDHDLLRSMEARNSYLIAAFRIQVYRINFRTAQGSALTPQQLRLRKIYSAIQGGSSNEILLPLIKDFLRGREYQSRAPNSLNSSIENIIRNTIIGDLVSYQLSAQEFWDASYRLISN